MLAVGVRADDFHYCGVAFFNNPFLEAKPEVLHFLLGTLRHQHFIFNIIVAEVLKLKVKLTNIQKESPCRQHTRSKSRSRERKNVSGGIKVH